MTIDSCAQERAWDLTADTEIIVSRLAFSSDEYQGTISQFSPDGRYYISGGVSLHWSISVVGPDE